MNYLLLLGAGFSRNWGGWLANEAFDYLLGCQEIAQSDYLKSLLCGHKRTGGFEAALAEVQQVWKQDSQQRRYDPPYFSTSKDNLDRFQSALDNMFKDMNKAFLSLKDFEFQTDSNFMARTFLVKFDAIFTLNQDLLLETRYLNPSVQLDANGKWNGWQIPGMREIENYLPSGSKVPVTKWVSETRDKFKVHDGLQPYFKLQGSSEWRNGSDSEMLVMGGNKESAIRHHEVLKWYYDVFLERLSRPATRLMVIGYSFGDDHINRAIIEGSMKGRLRLFIIDPDGVEVISNTNLTYTRKNNIYVRNELEEALQPIIIGSSKRTMREIFGMNTDVEHSKVMRFFR